MRKPEQRLWDSMARHRPPDVWLERVENVVGTGTPDVTCMARGVIAKVELKAAVAPVRATTRLLGEHGLSVAQIGWHRAAAAFELPVYTLIREITTKELFLIPCAFASRLNNMSLADLRKASAIGPQENASPLVASDWVAVYEALRSPRLILPYGARP